MARAYSQDLRDRVIEAVASAGLSRRAAARRFGVSPAAAIKWLQRFHRTGQRESAGTGGHRPSKIQPHRVWVRALVAAQPTLAASRLVFIDESGFATNLTRRRGRAPGASAAWAASPTGPGRRPPLSVRCG